MLREKRTFWRKLLSLPSWERGLKLQWCCTGETLAHVAPLVGAWIEMIIHQQHLVFPMVAPLVGAWIEIYQNNSKDDKYVSLPSWERGLKLYLKLTNL